jgi:hypothetical protein
MSTTSEFTRTAQEQILEGVRQSQKAVVNAVEIWAKAVEKAVPDVSSFADELPQPAQVVESAFDFAEKLLAAQREFARNVLAAATPALNAKPSSKTAKES